MSHAEKISPYDAHIKVAGGSALLVCAHEDSKCCDMLLENAILLSELKARENSLPKDQEIIFYCS
jgi:rhodanese-related sulfurtransferase